METNQKNKFNQAFGSFIHAMKNGQGKKVQKYTGKLVQLTYIVIFLIGATAVYNITNSEISGDFKVYSKDEKTGKTELFKFRAKKLQPKHEINSILTFEMHGSGARGVDFKRRTTQIFGMQVFLGGGAAVDMAGKATYKAGVSLGF